MPLIRPTSFPRSRSLWSTGGVVCAVFLWLAVWGSVTPVSAQGVEAATYSLAIRGEPLEAALRKTAELTRADVAWDPLLVSGKRSFCVATELPFEALLSCVLKGTGLDFVRRSSGLYVLELATEGPPLYGNLRGIVLDAESEQPVSNAHVYLADAGRGSVANQEGMFIFPRLLPGEYDVRVSHMGYRLGQVQVSITAGGDASTEIILQAEAVLIAPIIVDGLSMTPASSLLGSASATQEEVTTNLNAGTTGILQSLAAMPGVRVSDATADVHIQGGEAGEHQFRLDGAPVFIPLNVATFVGPFSPFALGKITVNKAGFRASLGSQIAGVIEAEHDVRAPAAAAGRGARPQRQFTVQVDPLSTNARFSSSTTTADGKHVTTLSAVRVGMWSLVAPPSLAGLLNDWNVVDTFVLSAFASENTPFSNLPPEGEPSLQFADVHQAVRIRFGALRTLNVSGYWGRSSIGNAIANIDLTDADGSSSVSSTDLLARFKDVYSWQNGMLQARYDVVNSAHVLTSARIRGSFYRLNHDFRAPDAASAGTTEDDGNFVYEVGAEFGADYFSDSGHKVETGAEILVAGTDFTVAGTQQLPIRHASTGLRVAAFAQDKLQVGSHGTVELGSRFTWLNSRSSLYFEPRLNTRFDFPDTRLGSVSFFVGTGLYRQFVNQFDVSSRSPRAFVSSTRFWMQNDHTVTPPKAAHLSAELLLVPNDAWSFSTESYYKKHYHILTLDYSASTDVERDLDQNDFLMASTGHAAGWSASVRRSIGAGSIRARFDYSSAKRTIQGQYGDKPVTVPWNEPFRLELDADIVPFKGAVLLARWKSVWDRAWGYRKSYYDFLSAYLGDVDALVEDMRANGVSTDAIRRVERQIRHYELTDPDSHLLPSVHQLDLSMAYSFRMGSYVMQVRGDAINVLNRKNTAEWLFRLDEDRYFNGGVNGLTGLLDRSDRDLLPRVVSVAARLTW